MLCNLLNEYCHENLFTCCSRGTREQQAILSGLQSSSLNNNVEIDSIGISYKRLKDDIDDADDGTQPPSKKPHQSTHEDFSLSVECTKSAVLYSNSDTSKSFCASASRRLDGLQARRRAFYRPFETSSVDDCDADTDTSPDDNRCDVSSWADCLRQLATSLRQRQGTDDSRQAVVRPDDDRSSAEARSVERLTTASDHLSPPDRKHRDSNDDVVQSVNDVSGDAGDRNFPVNRLDTSTTKHIQRVDCQHYPPSLNAAAVESHQCRGLNASTHARARPSLRFSALYAIARPPVRLSVCQTGVS